MNKFLKLHWVSIILIFLSAVLITILIRQTKELKSEIAFKQDKINELENEVERVKKLNVELEITSRFNSNLEKSNNSHQERFKAENISDVGATVVYRKVVVAILFWKVVKDILLQSGLEAETQTLAKCF